jgi:mannose/cellobiose epimerase-like protein (N-acyl-D-glucosamine 2-epimerase family)
MAEGESSGVPVLPGDLVQVTAQGHRFRGGLGVVSEVRRRGVGAVLQALDADGRLVEAYERLRPDQFAVVGRAVLVTPEIQRAREDAERTAAAVARESGR